MKTSIKLIILAFLVSSCGAMLKPVIEPIGNFIEDYEKEIEVDSCEHYLISLVMIKRLIEQKFPDNINELDNIDFARTIDTSEFSEPEIKEYKDNMITAEKEWVIPWTDQCKLEFDTISLYPYSTDSLRLNWTKIYEIENGIKKVCRESWILAVESDSLIEPYFLNIELELIDSTGRVISRMSEGELK